MEILSNFYLDDQSVREYESFEKVEVNHCQGRKMKRIRNSFNYMLLPDGELMSLPQYFLLELLQMSVHRVGQDVNYRIYGNEYKLKITKTLQVL